jgi:hypothetical protein
MFHVKIIFVTLFFAAAQNKLSFMPEATNLEYKNVVFRKP